MKHPPIRRSLSILLPAFLLGACGSNKTGDTAQAPSLAVPVKVVSVVERPVPVQIRAIGTVEAFSTVTLMPQIDGQLAEIHFREGQWVSRGDRLFTIDPRPFEAALRQAEANLHRARAELDNAVAEAKRKDSLATQGFVSTEENDAAQTRAASLRASVKGAEAAFETAKLQLQYCYIDSPIDGRIGELLEHSGNVVRRNETRLAVIKQLRPVYVGFSVRDQDLAEVRRRAASETLEVEAIIDKGSEPVRGNLTFINNAVDPDTGTVLLKAEFANADERLWPGQFVEVRLTLHIEPNALVIPLGAILTGQQGTYVFVVKADSTVEARGVTVGLDLGGEVTITEGLAAGDPVVTDGQIRLAPGTKVERKDNLAFPPDASGGIR